jgi:hypothetical protein
MTAFVEKLGVVGEGPAIRGAYLAFSSRLLKRRAICLLRRGAPSGGKNYLFEIVFQLIPEEAIVRVSSSSPLALIYYGAGDENSLKYHIVYIPEAASLVERGGTESPMAVMLRGLISEGSIDRIVTVTRPNAPPESVRVRRKGPIVAALTSARPNIEEELLTRLMNNDADESDWQTRKVVKRVLAEEEADLDPAEIDKWLDYQRLLQLDAPFEVVIPYRKAIWLAFIKNWHGMRKKGERLQLRIRRDSHGFLSAIRTSAVLHQAERDKDEKGRVIATLDDYGHAHEAFDAGLAALHQVKTPETLIAVIKAVEAMGATKKASARVTVRALMDRLGIASFKTALERLRDAEARGLLVLVDQIGGYGATEARSYTLGKSSSDITAEVAANPFSGVFPTQEQVAAAAKFIFPRGPYGTREQGEQNRSSGGTKTSTPDNGSNCSPCSLVPAGPAENKKSLDEDDTDNFQEKRL